MQAGEMLAKCFKSISYARSDFRVLSCMGKTTPSKKTPTQLLQAWWFSQLLNSEVTAIPFMLQINNKDVTSCGIFMKHSSVKIGKQFDFHKWIYVFEKTLRLKYTYYILVNCTHLWWLCVLYCFETVLWVHYKLLCKANHFWHTSCLRLLWLSAQLHNSLLSLNMISEPSGDTRAAIECVWAIATVYFTPH